MGMYLFNKKTHQVAKLESEWGPDKIGGDDDYLWTDKAIPGSCASIKASECEDWEIAWVENLQSDQIAYCNYIVMIINELNNKLYRARIIYEQ